MMNLTAMAIRDHMMRTKLIAMGAKAVTEIIPQMIAARSLIAFMLVLGLS